ncbi:MAG TPA: hypothetical protein VE439_09270 [Anaerolineae bacterium]|jgi:hypothetical protein|nr:hypothetical protein [Anaerolineae bacterium]
MEFSDIVILFAIGFLFGLLSRVLYSMMTGNLRQPVKHLKPVKKVKYISPKSNENIKRASKGQEAHSDRKAANQ